MSEQIVGGAILFIVCIIAGYYVGKGIIASS